MATIPTSLQFQLQILLLLLILLSLFISAATSAASPSISPSSDHHQELTAYSPILFASIFDNLGFQELSTAAVAANLSTATPLTIFAPSDSSLLTCPSCFLPQLLMEHAVPGMYPLHFLRGLAFGTKIETLAPNYCLTITSSASTDTNSSSNPIVFVNGAEISSPDLFNNGVVVIHGLQGFVSHLSPLSCDIERMATLSFPQLSANKFPSSSSAQHFSIMRLMLKDAVLRLRFNGYSVLALALRMKFRELSELKSMTVFALDDFSVFSGGGPAFLSNFWFHVVPNRRIMAAELVTFPSATVLPTMEVGQNLMVTTAGGGGLLAPMKINYVGITTLDVLHNSRIVVHGLTTPFPHMHFPDQVGPMEGLERSGSCDSAGQGGGICEVEAPMPAGIRSTGYLEVRRDHDRDRGL
ncbi:hypothetical protein ACH5RR_002301 [Cinchona calisaya]|uniref:FAS1 domain-containing protein n=1 Tax=Cinchona calisaya TaxID=153742 RepID=A0ABD3B5V5_9GENT